jgi:hypothetical protein
VRRRTAAASIPPPVPASVSPVSASPASRGAAPVCLVAADAAAGLTPLVVTVAEGEELLVGRREGAVDVYLPLVRTPHSDEKLQNL